MTEDNNNIHTHPRDTHTHRLHMMQMRIDEIKEFIEKLQVRRASIVEKIEKAKIHSSIARELKINKQFQRIVSKIDTILAGVSDDLDDAADRLNKARALFFEASGGEVIITKEKTDGT